MKTRILHLKRTKFVVMLFCFFLSNLVSAQSGTITSVATGNWNADATWANVNVTRTGTISCSTGSTTVTGSGTLFLTELTVGSVIQRTNGNAIGTVAAINSNTSLTLTANAGSNQTSQAYRTISGPPSPVDTVIIDDNDDVTVNVNSICAALTIASGGNDSTVIISGTNSLTVNGVITINNGTGSGDNKIIQVGAGSLTCNSVSIADTTNDNRDSEITISTGTVNVNGNIIMSGNANRNAIRFSGAGVLNIGGTGTMSGGSLVPSNGTVNYNGSGAQNVGAYTYYNLTTSNSGTKTLNANISVTNSLSIEDTTVLVPNAANRISNSSPINLNGGTYRSGTTAGFSDTVGVLTLSENSNIILGTGNHTLTFANSSSASWTTNKILTITGWVGGYNGTAASGTNPKLFVGSTNTALTNSQLNQIQFFNGSTNFPATLLSTGELVPIQTRVGDFSPSAVCAGATISITGFGFTGVTAVRVNGVNVASYTVNSATSITATLSTSNTTGTVSVVTGAGTFTSTNSLIVSPIPTTVTAVASASAICIGSSLNLTSSGDNTPVDAISRTTSPALAIPDNDTNGITSTITIPTTCATASAIATVSVNITHTWNADLDIFLVAPNGSQIELSTDNGGNGDNYTATFQTGGAVLPTGNSTINGTFAPEQAFSNLTGAASGIWTLRVVDDEGSDLGTLNSWGITFDSTTCPLTYSWTSAPSGFSSALQNPAGVSPTVNTTYTVTATNIYGCTTSASTVEVVVNPTSVGGTVSGGTAICSGASSGVLTLSGNTGNVVRWESAVSPFTTWNPIVNTTSTYTSGALTQTTQFRAVVQSGVCSEANSTPTTVSINTTTWTSASGGSWSNGAPDATTAAVIAFNYTSSGNIDACSLTVNNDAVVVISSGDVVTLSGGLTVATGSSFTLENEAYLMQEGSSNPNSGNITVKQESQALMRLDYGLWSSPVENQNLLAFSPLTIANRFYTYNTTTDVYATIVPSTNSFTTGKGYLIRMPDNHPASPTVWEGNFIGKPNSGDLTIALSTAGSGYNAVGNPYPSPISIDTFIDDNNSVIDGDLFFWRKTNGAAGSAYVTYSGGVFSDGPHAVDNIQPGQGFIVKATAASNLQFNNGQRATGTGVFYRNAQETATSRLWLQLKNNNTVVGSMAVGYREDATNAIDSGLDGNYINDSALALTSIVEGTLLAVQQRATFDATDVVPLAFITNSAGTYEITLHAFDGLFANDQNVYVRDNVTGAEHNLKDGSYSFTTATGVFNERFELIYQSTLSVENPVLSSNVVVYTQEKNMHVAVQHTTLSEVKIFDMRGRLVKAATDVNDATYTADLSAVANQVLIVQVKTAEGEWLTRKIAL